jgi:hypothetical protein
MALKAVPSFASILDRPVSQIEKPKPLPQGTYLMRVKGLGEVGKSTKKGTDQVKFTFEFMGAGDEVDEDDLKAAGGWQGKTLSNNTTTFYITDTAAWRLKWFLEEVLTIPTEDDEETDEETGEPLSRTLSQMLMDVPGRTFWAKIKHTSSEDGKQTYMEIADMAAVGDEDDE